MMEVSSAEFERNFGHYRDVVQTRPVTVLRDGRDGAVMTPEAKSVLAEVKA
jgi:PHD/YefM family antitoxin component YafN of YafNO toxin-antitoxin module